MKITFLLLLLIIISFNVQAGSKRCDTFLTELLVRSTGELLVVTEQRNDYMQLCNLNVNWNNRKPETCQQWFTQLLSAYVQQRQIRIWFSFGNEDYECNTMPTYGNTPPVTYVGS